MARDWTQDEVIKDLERVIEKQDKEIERLREALKDIANNPECLCGQKEMQVVAYAALKDGE